MPVKYTFDQLCSVNRDRPLRRAVRKAVISLQKLWSPRSLRLFCGWRRHPGRSGNVNNNKPNVRASRTETGHDEVRSGADLRGASPLVSFNHVIDPHFVAFSSSFYTTICNPKPNHNLNPNLNSNLNLTLTLTQTLTLILILTLTLQ